ncbi:CRISPR-associated endonuclease Cas1 [Planktothrix serta]
MRSRRPPGNPVNAILSFGYPLSHHTWGSVETWGQGPKITEYPSSLIV